MSEDFNLQHAIDEAADLCHELKLDALKTLKDFNVITPVEYNKVLKRIHYRKMKETVVGLRESTKNFIPDPIIVPQGKYTENVEIKEGITLSYATREP
jgi:hypothetical protein